MPRFTPLPVVIVLAVLCVGCTSQRRTYPGHDPGVLWTAMVAVADTPDYGEGEDGVQPWVVKENHAHARPEDRRIEIYRELVRTTDLEKVEKYTERRTFRFQIMLETLNPPTVSFVSRGTGFPRHAIDEAQRYFDDLSAIVGDPTDVLGPLTQGGASTPEVAVRDLLYAMFRRDEAAIRRVIVPHPGAAVLWTGDPEGGLPPAARDRLERRIIRPARIGEVIEIDGMRVRVTQPYVEGDERVILATVAGEPLAPFQVLRVDDRWRVDVSRIIARKRAADR